MNVHIEFRDDDGAAVELEARTATGVLLATAGAYIAALVGVNIRADGLVGAGLAELHLKSWVQLFEDTLLDSLVAASVPGYVVLKADRQPKIETHDAVRDDSGRIIRTVKRLAPEQAPPGVGQ